MIDNENFNEFLKFKTSRSDYSDYILYEERTSGKNLVPTEVVPEDKNIVILTNQGHFDFSFELENKNIVVISKDRYPKGYLESIFGKKIKIYAQPYLLIEGLARYDYGDAGELRLRVAAVLNVTYPDAYPLIRDKRGIYRSFSLPHVNVAGRICFGDLTERVVNSIRKGERAAFMEYIDAIFRKDKDAIHLYTSANSLISVREGVLGTPKDPVDLLKEGNIRKFVEYIKEKNWEEK